MKMRFNIVASGSCLAILIVECPSFAQYAPGFIWNREADWTPGTVLGSTDGNPDDDSLGNPTWHYERSIGGALGSPDVWYEQARSPLVWSTNSGTDAWRFDDALDQSPGVVANGMGQSLVGFTFESSICRWQNPSGAALLLDIAFDTDVVSFRLDSGSVVLQLAIVRMDATGSEFELLWSGERTAPHNQVLQDGSVSTLKSIALQPGDSVLFTYRNLLAFPLSGNGATTWNELASLTIIAVPCPGDADDSGIVTFGDVTSVLGNWLADYSPGTGPGDANADGIVDFGDITAVLGNWLAACP